MAHLIGFSSGGHLRVLDPGAGAGILACAACEAAAERANPPAAVEVVAYETDQRLAAHLSRVLTHATDWLRPRGIALRYKVRTDDFVLAHADALGETLRLFPSDQDADEHFDVAIANPPYFKIPKVDPRAIAAASVVHGQPNIYALFMAIMAALMRPGGQFVCISPRSYAAGPYFRQFRERFFSTMRPEAIHLFGSRRDAFAQDDVLQENIILLARRADGWRTRPTSEAVRVSLSAGVHDLGDAQERRVPLAEVIYPADSDWVLHVPGTTHEDAALRFVRGWRGSLHAYGMQISTGPVVAFRAAHLLAERGDVARAHAPLLWLQNVRAMKIEWPLTGIDKAQYIAIEPAAGSLLVPDRNYVLLRRFSAKEQARRLTAAPLLAGALGSRVIGIENHLNYIHRPGGALTPEEAYGLAALLNSDLLDTYFRVFNGNTQVSATELRAMPLPPLDTIHEIGRQFMSGTVDVTQIDGVIDDVLGLLPTNILSDANYEQTRRSARHSQGIGIALSTV